MVVDAPFIFTTGARILDASKPAVEAHAPNTLLIATEAQTNIVGRSGTGFGGEVGIGNLPAHNTHQITVPFSQCTFGLQWILESSNTDDREINGFADSAGNERCIARGNMHAGFDHEQTGSGHSD